MEDLIKYRNQIDQIDNEIVNLLIKRTKIVEKVGEYKSLHSKTSSFIRSGREANMLRDLIKKLEKTFPPQAVATIWRMIISTSLSTEQKMTIKAYAYDGNDLCYWQAREYYGNFIDIECSDNLNEIISDVERGVCSVGILPLVEDEKEPWWIRPESEKNDIFVFARIPFVESKDYINKPVLAIANVIPENTNEDISLITINSNSQFDKVENLFLSFDLKIRLLKSYKNNHLVEVNKFININDECLLKLKEESKDNIKIRLLGSYASPIII